jgi:Helicase HerA, central domain
VLGVLRQKDGCLHYVPSHRRLPHVGSPVAFLSDELLCEVARHNSPGAELGFFTLGEFVYCGGDARLTPEPWMDVRSPAVVIKFDAHSLISRRSFVFARAGFGKSNLIKLLFSNLYETTPTTQKRGRGDVPVGTVIFDPDGEYFWPDDKNRPGLCDVPHLLNKLVIFTNQQGPSPFYGSFVAAPIRMDIRRLPASTVVGITLTPDRQTQQNVIKLRRLSPTSWQSLVDLLYRDGMQASDQDIAAITHMTVGRDDAEIAAARSNMVHIVSMLHDPSSQMLDALMGALRDGKLCVVDISQMRGDRGRILGGIILQRIFNHNQEEWTKPRPETIPVIAVIEEAQSVLGEVSKQAEDPYVVWTKEGRKYDLGSMLVTQQPGSIDSNLLSQGDNWFIFHLLSAVDLAGVKRANSHFSDDLLSSLLNEPIIGNGIFWSGVPTSQTSPAGEGSAVGQGSTAGQAYPLPFRPLAFEKIYKALDPDYSSPAAPTWAAKLRERLARLISHQADVVHAHVDETVVAEAEVTKEPGSEDPGAVVDVMATYTARAIESVKNDSRVMTQLRSDRGSTWMNVQKALEQALPAEITERPTIAYELVRPFMNTVFGKGQWHVDRRPGVADPTKRTSWLVMGPEMAGP